MRMASQVDRGEEVGSVQCAQPSIGIFGNGDVRARPDDRRLNTQSNPVL